jgi:hypothetical protein
MPNTLSAEEVSESIGMLMQCSERLDASCGHYWSLRLRLFWLSPLWAITCLALLFMLDYLGDYYREILRAAPGSAIAGSIILLWLLGTAGYYVHIRLAGEMHEARKRVRFYVVRLTTIARVVSQVQDKGRLSTWDRLRLGIALSDAELALEQALKIDKERDVQLKKDYPLLRDSMLDNEQAANLRMPVPRHDP